MPYYRVCPNCGDRLDPGEVCDCKKEVKDETKEKHQEEKKEAKSA